MPVLDSKHVLLCLKRLREMDDACATPGAGIRKVVSAAKMVKKHSSISSDDACETLFMPDLGSLLGHACVAAVLCMENCDTDD